MKDAKIKAFWGDDASVQPSHLQEVMLHETAVAWLRRRLTETLPRRPWEETPVAFATRLRSCCAYVNDNDNHDVSGLCHGFPKCVHKLVEGKGKRLAE